MSSRKTRHNRRHWITRLRFSHHWGLISLRSVCWVDIYSLDCRFSLDLRLRLLGLLLLILCAVILIMVDCLVVVRHFVGWSKFSCNLAVKGSKFGFEHDNSGQCRWWITALPAGVSNSIVVGLHFFLESVSICLEELFEDVVNHIADTARLALCWQEHEPDRLNELRLYADFWKPTAEVAYVPFTQIGLAEMWRNIWLNIGVVCHNYGLVVKHGGCLTTEVNCTPKVGHKTFGVQFYYEAYLWRKTQLRKFST